jgi:hypothetical protein
MNTQQKIQVRPFQKLALVALGIVFPLGTLASSLPASAHEHFGGLRLNFSSDSDHRSIRDRHHTSDDYFRHRRPSYPFFSVNEYPFERYEVFYRLDNDSDWIREESYRSRYEAELEVRRLEHKGYFAKLVRE